MESPFSIIRTSTKPLHRKPLTMQMSIKPVCPSIHPPIQPYISSLPRHRVSFTGCPITSFSPLFSHCEVLLQHVQIMSQVKVCGCHNNWQYAQQHKFSRGKHFDDRVSLMQRRLTLPPRCLWCGYVLRVGPRAGAIGMVEGGCSQREVSECLWQSALALADQQWAKWPILSAP